MNNKTKFMNDYIDSLGGNQLNEGQEAFLLVGQSNELFGEGNGKCENRAESCSGTTNKRKCTNGNSTGCADAENKGDCSSLETSVGK